MKFGVVLPPCDAQTVADVAYDVEQAGWDGLFIWEPIWGFDAWMLLAMAATRTKRIRLGTLLSPLPRMRPWKIASETVTLDHLSNGRTILSVGIGWLPAGFTQFGEETDRKIRAECLDEGLDIITQLWAGTPFDYQGKHYQVSNSSLPSVPPPPIQMPRIPIWVAGSWPYPKSIRRPLRYDGWLISVLSKNRTRVKVTPDHVREMQEYVRKNRQNDAPFDIIIEGQTPCTDHDKATSIVSSWAEAGLTWWIETRWAQGQNDAEVLERLHQRIRQGPPRL